MPAPDRARLVAAAGREVARALESYDLRAEALRVAGTARAMAGASVLLLVGAALVGAAAVARAATGDTTAVLLLSAGGMAVAGMLLLPAYQRRERARLGARLAELGERLRKGLRTTVERELEASHKRALEAMAPYSRFVRAETERLRAQQEELGSLQKGMEALRARVESLR
jgi:hypothetical protein